MDPGREVRGGFLGYWWSVEEGTEAAEVSWQGSPPFRPEEEGAQPLAPLSLQGCGAGPWELRPSQQGTNRIVTRAPLGAQPLLTSRQLPVRLGLGRFGGSREVFQGGRGRGQNPWESQRTGRRRGSLGAATQGHRRSSAFSRVLGACLICTADPVPFTKLLFVQQPRGGRRRPLPPCPGGRGPAASTSAPAAFAALTGPRLQPQGSPLGLAGSFSPALPETPASELPLAPTALSPQP